MSAVLTDEPQQAPAPEKPPESIEDILNRFPILVAHLICESLGYFTPQAAANAILSHRQGFIHACEWYMHMAGRDRDPLQVGRDVLNRAFKARRHHRGYMAHYPQARALVEAVRTKQTSGPVFSSWQ